VAQRGTQVTVIGTSRDDSFEFAAGDVKHTLTINQDVYEFEATEVTGFEFDGSEGSDTALLTGSAAEDDVAELHPLTGTLTSAEGVSPGYQVEVVNAENIVADGGGGQDEARLHDSALDDLLEADHDFARLAGYYFANEARQFDEVTAISTSGGHDTKDIEETIEFLLTPEGPWVDL